MFRNEGVDAGLQGVLVEECLVFAFHDVGGSEVSGKISLATLEETVDFTRACHRRNEIERLLIAQHGSENVENFQVECRRFAWNENEKNDMYLVRILSWPLDTSCARGNRDIRSIQPFQAGVRYGKTFHQHSCSDFFAGQYFVGQRIASR